MSTSGDLLTPEGRQNLDKYSICGQHFLLDGNILQTASCLVLQNTLRAFQSCNRLMESGSLILPEGIHLDRKGKQSHYTLCLSSNKKSCTIKMEHFSRSSQDVSILHFYERMRGALIHGALCAE